MYPGIQKPSKYPNISISRIPDIKTSRLMGWNRYSVLGAAALLDVFVFLVGQAFLMVNIRIRISVTLQQWPDGGGGFQNVL